MKPIKLTDTQKDKLLEMTRKLFSEYDCELKLRNNVISLGEKHLDLYIAETHWFEFCMTHLIVKLTGLLPSKYRKPESLMEMYNFYWDASNYTITRVHPVDYLYEQFKKLK